MLLLFLKIKRDFFLIPAHVAIIMDGNGRWAKKKSLPRIFGHKQGVKTIKEIVKSANDIGVKVLSLYAFSTETRQIRLIPVKFSPPTTEGAFLPSLWKLRTTKTQSPRWSRPSGIYALSRRFSEPFRRRLTAAA